MHAPGPFAVTDDRDPVATEPRSGRRTLVVTRLGVPVHWGLLDVSCAYLSSSPSVVTAPSDAEETSATYLAMTPRRTLGTGGGHCGAARGEVGVHVEPAVRDVERDRVAVADERDRPAVRRLGGDVSGHEAVGGAAEAPVGDEGHGVAEAAAVDGGGDREHLAHARAPLRTFVADDDDVAVLHLAALDPRERRLLAVVDARRA